MPSARRFDARQYWEERLSARFDLRGVGDIGLAESYNQFLYRVRKSTFRRAIDTLSGEVQDWEVLDVGSGTGFYVDQWIALGPQSVCGSDLTETSVRNLVDRFPGSTILRCDIAAPLEAEFTSRAFDVVSAFDVLFHIVDDQEYETALANFSALVRPGGYLLFSDNLMDTERRYGAHQVCRKEAKVRSLLQQHGFAVDAVLPSFVLMNEPVRSNSRALRSFFRAVYRLASSGETCGRLVGGFLLPIEKALVRVLRRGPSTETFVCRRMP